MDQFNQNGGSESDALPTQSNQSMSKSIAKRIRESACELVGNSVWRPSTNTAISSLATIVENRGKGQFASVSTTPSALGSSSGFHSSQSFTVQDEQHHHIRAAEPESSRLRKNSIESNDRQFCFEEFAPGQELFRPQSQSQFQPKPQRNPYASLDTEFDKSCLESSISCRKDGISYGLGPSELPLKWAQGTPRPSTSIVLDGAAVVALLCDPNFSPEGESDYIATNPPDQFGQLDHEAPRIRPLVDLYDEKANLLLDTNGRHYHISCGSLSTTTEVDSCEENGGERGSSHRIPNDTISGSWLDNYKSYQDEVWGYLSPTIRTDKAENNEMAEVDSTGVLTKQSIIERLAMIQRHINPTWKRR